MRPADAAPRPDADALAADVAPAAAHAARSFALGWLLAWALAAGALLALSLRISPDMAIYALDDAYIHLALAEQLAQGHYGINAGEAASPSSSVLYPFLLAALLTLGLGAWAPLALCLGAAGAATYLSARFIRARILPPPTAGGEALSRRLLAHGLALAALLATGAVALPFTGMEHMLHVLLCIICLCGLARLGEGGARTGALLILAIAALPLVRFEGAAMAAAMMAVLALSGRWAAALAAGALAAAALGGYAALMTGLGLPVLPSSVLTKSDLSAAVVDGGAGAGALAGMAKKAVWDVLTTRWGAVLGAVGLGAGGYALGLVASRGRAALRGADFMVALVVAATAGGHLAAGAWGWFYRYEVYAVATCALGAGFLLRGALAGAGAAAVPGIVLAAVVAFGANAVAIPRTLSAMAEIHGQQMQMRRFAQALLPVPVAVNDIGLVAYGSPAYVLDLWGLGNEAARKARARPDWGPEAVAALAQDAGVGFAMIYEDWFAGAVPSAWRRMAVLRTTGPERVIVGGSEVAFYLVDPALEARMEAALDAFEATLLPGTTLIRD